MKRFGVVLGLACLTAAGTATLDACTATDVLTASRDAQRSEQRRAARDVASEFIDEEAFLRDELTIDGGAGTLLLESSYYGLQVPNGGRTAADWRAVLDRRSERGHGRSADGVTLEVPPAQAASGTATIREHMRLHVWEWDQFIRGNDGPVRASTSLVGQSFNPSSYTWGSTALAQNNPYASSGSSAQPSSPSAQSPPAPAPSSPVPATSAPLPTAAEAIVHHAG